MLKVRIKNSTKLFPLDLIKFVSDNGVNYFELKSSAEEEISLFVAYNLIVHSDYEESNFNCTPFISPIFYKENNIFEVHESDKKIGRIGWLFPIQSLVSDQHSFSNNVHFLKYAFIVTKKILTGELYDVDIIHEIDELQTNVEISDIFHSDLLVLTSSNQKTSKIENFSIENYLPSLYTYRIFISSTFDEINYIQKINSSDAPPTLIKVTRISILLRNEIFIDSLYTSQLKFNNHPLVQFHLLYQIIELLLNRVMDAEVFELLQLANEGKLTNHEINSKMKRLPAEDYRLNLIFEKYLKNQPLSGAILVAACNKLIINFEDEKKSIKDALYKVRNIIVHNYRGVTAINGADELVKTINFEFEILAAELLAEYKENTLSNSSPEEPMAWLYYQLSLENNSPS